jgi:hypothetical protein
MPPTPLAGNPATGTRDQAGAPGTRAPALVIRGHSLRTGRALLSRRPARRAQAAPPAAACPDTTGSAKTDIRGDRLQRITRPLRTAPKTGASYHDPLFERPDLVENDYHRFRHQPRGW